MPLIAITGAMFLIFIAFVWLTYKSKRPEESAAN
jgi:cbb3-type cytochrome oxidase subunit 3